MSKHLLKSNSWGCILPRESSTLGVDALRLLLLLGDCIMFEYYVVDNISRRVNEGLYSPFLFVATTV